MVIRDKVYIIYVYFGSLHNINVTLLSNACWNM